MWTAVDKLGTESVARSYERIFKTQITYDTLYCNVTVGGTYFRASEMCLLFTTSLYKHNTTSSKQETGGHMHILHCLLYCEDEMFPDLSEHVIFIGIHWYKR